MASVARRVLPAVALDRRLAAFGLGPAAAALTVTGCLVGLGLANGGYFPVSWGWSSLALLAVAAAVLAAGGADRPSLLELLQLVLLIGFGSWVAASAAWSLNVTSTVEEAERTAVYLAGAAAVVLLARRA